MRTGVFRKQHAELERFANDIIGSLEKGFPGDLRRALGAFSVAIRAHLTIEDKSMYPVMLNDDSAEIREMAAEYQRTMGNLLAVFNAYYSEWSVIGHIEEDRGRFVRETLHITGKLKARMRLENENLYAAIDRADLVVTSRS